MKSKIKNAWIALILCICLLFSGSIRPFFASASPGDEEYADEYTEGDDEYVDDTDYSEPSDDGDSNSVEAKYQDKIDSITERLKELEAENKKIQASINDAKDEKEKAIAKKNAIDWQISITKEEIAQLMERIDILEQDIEDKLKSIELKQKDIEKKQGEIDDNYEILRKRLRAKYMQDTTSTLGLIVGSDSFSDLLTRVEYVRRIAEHDRDLLARLADQRAKLEDEKTGLEEDLRALETIKASVEDDKQETESKKDVLNVQVAEAQLQIQDIAEMERAYLADLEKNKKIQDEAKAELDRIYREIEWSKNAYAGGVMAWPLPAYTPGRGLSVTSEFGPRFGGTDNHTGIDLSGTGVYGSNIVAANDGTVVKANLTYANGVGYGKYVMIDHGVDEQGRTISTIYAHCSSLSVSEGQTVRKGQVIAQVGSTGWSTGPHLHFEVRIGGTPVPPRPYIFS